MSRDQAFGTVFIQENALLPAGLSVETEAFLPGWVAVVNLDAGELRRQIEGAGWNFFYLAGDVRVSVLGRYGPGTVRRAVKRLLFKRKDERFNSLQITKVVSKRFLGIPMVTVTAHSRHIQESAFLVPLDVALATSPLAAPETGLPASLEVRQTVRRRHTALISSS